MVETCDRCHRPFDPLAWRMPSHFGEQTVCGARMDDGGLERGDDCDAARDKWLAVDVARLIRIESRLAQYRDGLPERGEVLVVRAALTTILEGRP